MIVYIKDIIKRRFGTHTLESATILPDPDELSDEQLRNVIGGMTPRKFEEWRVQKINEDW